MYDEAFIPLVLLFYKVMATDLIITIASMSIRLQDKETRKNQKML